MFLRRLDGFVTHVTVGRWVIGISTVVTVDSHDTIALIGIECTDRGVDRNLLVVYAETVTLGVWVTEKTGLEDWICGGFHARDHVRGRESDLFYFGKVILWISIQMEFSKGAERDERVRPDFCDVEDIPRELFSSFRGEHLQIACP